MVRQAENMKPLNTNYPKASHEAPKPMAIQNSHAPSQDYQELMIFNLFSMFLYFFMIFGFKRLQLN